GSGGRPTPASASWTPSGRRRRASAAVGGRPSSTNSRYTTCRSSRRRWVSSASTVAPLAVAYRDEEYAGRVTREPGPTGLRGRLRGRRPSEPAPDNAGGGRIGTMTHQPSPDGVAVGGGVT